MGKIRSFVVSFLIMFIISMLCLLVASALTYLFKWQADKVMVGIIVTYILAGFVGGSCFKRLEKKQYGDEKKIGVGRKSIEAFFLSGIFVLLLLIVSILVLRNPFEISARFLMILALVISSCFLGRIL